MVYRAITNNDVPGSILENVSHTGSIIRNSNSANKPKKNNELPLKAGAGRGREHPESYPLTVAGKLVQRTTVVEQLWLLSLLQSKNNSNPEQIYTSFTRRTKQPRALQKKNRAL